MNTTHVPSKTVVLAIAATVLLRSPSMPQAMAAIYEWEYISPMQPHLGRQASSTLVPDGADVVAGPSTDLSGLNLTKAYLYDRDLRYADFSGTNLSTADFERADLRYATLAGANLANAEIERASFSGSDLSFAQLASTASYDRKSLTYVELSGLEMIGWDLSGQDLLWANISQSDLSGANLGRARLSSAHFQNATLANANFTEATLYGTYFASSNLTGADFTDAYMRSSGFTSATLSQANITHANLREARINGSDMAGSNLSDATLTDATIRNTDLTGANLSHVVAEGADFEASRFENADLSGSRFVDASFRLAIMTGANLTDADIRGTDLYRTTQYGLTLEQIYSTASYKNRDLTGIDFSSNTLSGGYFASQDMTGSQFRVANLSGANLDDASFRDAYLALASLRGASCRGTDFTNASFSQATLVDADFSSANLSDATFGWSDITGADFTDADISGASFGFLDGSMTAEQIASTANYKRRSMTGLYFVDNTLDDWSLASQDLTGTSFDSTELLRVDFRDANLKDTLFSNTVLIGADMRGARNYREAGPVHDLNMIRPDGVIDGLDLSLLPDWSRHTLVVRDYDGNAELGIGPMGIHVRRSFAMGPNSILELRWGDNAWDSLITVDPDLTAELHGTLKLVNSIGQALSVGNIVTILTADGLADEFDTVTGRHIGNGLYFEDTYIGSDVILEVQQAVLGDMQGDGAINTEDINAFILALTNPVRFAATHPELYADVSGDVNNDGVLNTQDIETFVAMLTGAGKSGVIPEPTPLSMLLLGFSAAGRRRSARQSAVAAERGPYNTRRHGITHDTFRDEPAD